MKRVLRFGLFIFVAVVAIATLYVANFYITLIKDDAAKATIVAGVITFFGVIFSAMYNEISAYYKERSESINRKWDMIFPFIKNHYNPWINSAKSLLSSLDLNPNALSADAVTRVLYLTAVFYGYRLRFIVNDGGLILLSSDKEDRKVENAYREIERKFQWAKDETPRRVSYLQNLFLSRNKPDDPYVLSKFTDDLKEDQVLEDSRKILWSWLTKENIDELKVATKDFIECFKASIDKLYTAWGD